MRENSVCHMSELLCQISKREAQNSMDKRHKIEEIEQIVSTRIVTFQLSESNYRTGESTTDLL